MTVPTPKYLPPKKPKKISARRGILLDRNSCFLSLVVLLIGVTLGITGSVLVWYVADWVPRNEDLALTQTQFAADAQQTVVALAGTAETNRQQSRLNSDRATEAALFAMGTQAALSNEGVLLDQTATLISRNLVATQTAEAVFGTQRLTQIALSYNATQVGLQQNATQVELDFQETQAALSGNPSAANTSSGPVSARSLRQTTPTATPPPTSTRPPSEAAAFGQTTIIDDDFTGTLPLASDWEYREDQWRNAGDGIIAMQNNAALQTRMSDFTDYRFRVTFTPTTQPSDYFVYMTGSNQNQGVALQITASRERVTRVSLFQYEQQPDNVDTNILTLREANQPIEGGALTLTVETNEDRLTVLLDGETVLSVTVPDAFDSNRLGLQFPSGTLIDHVQVSSS